MRPAVRAATGNFGWMAAERIARFVLGLGMSFWVARHLGPAQFGLLNYAVAMVGLLLPLAELGIDAIVRREFIRGPSQAAAWAAAAVGLRLAGGALAASLVLMALAFDGAVSPERRLLAVLALTLFQPALLVPELWLQAKLQARSSALAQTAALAVGAVVRMGLIVAEAPLVGFAWAVVAENVVAGILLAYAARCQGFSRGSFPVHIAIRLLRESWPLLLSGFAVAFYMRIDLVMLRALASEAEVGVYAAATRFVEAGYFLPMALAASLLPSLLRARARGPRAYEERLQACYDLNAALAYALAVPMALAAPWLVRIAYGPAYAAAGPILALYAWSIVFVFLGVARGQFLVNEGHTRFYLLATVVGLTVNVVLNFALIPRVGAWGAALATVVSQSVAAWISTFFFAPLRPNAWMQTRALLIPFTWYRYVRRN